RDEGAEADAVSLPPMAVLHGHVLRAAAAADEQAGVWHGEDFEEVELRPRPRLELPGDRRKLVDGRGGRTHIAVVVGLPWRCPVLPQDRQYHTEDAKEDQAAGSRGSRDPDPLSTLRQRGFAAPSCHSLG